MLNVRSVSEQQFTYLHDSEALQMGWKSSVDIDPTKVATTLIHDHISSKNESWNSSVISIFQRGLLANNHRNIAHKNEILEGTGAEKDHEGDIFTECKTREREQLLNKSMKSVSSQYSIIDIIANGMFEKNMHSFLNRNTGGSVKGNTLENAIVYQDYELNVLSSQNIKQHNFVDEAEEKNKGFFKSRNLALRYNSNNTEENHAGNISSPRKSITKVRVSDGIGEDKYKFDNVFSRPLSHTELSPSTSCSMQKAKYVESKDEHASVLLSKLRYELDHGERILNQLSHWDNI
mmetsp:Transcript_36528/g.44063  ORF Transcript_36528/g.44063 Transcript_36528/m.44063 type:complete len:291 (+) Transcript_36528:171-1043(+)